MGYNYTQPSFIETFVEVSLASIKTMLYMGGYALLFAAIWTSMQGSEAIMVAVIDGSFLQAFGYALLGLAGAGIGMGFLTASAKTFVTNVQVMHLQLRAQTGNKRRTA